MMKMYVANKDDDDNDDDYNDDDDGDDRGSGDCPVDDHSEDDIDNGEDNENYLRGCCLLNELLVPRWPVLEVQGDTHISENTK